jgi:hypothetical protein
VDVNPLRCGFLHGINLTEAVLYLLQIYDDECIVGSGCDEDITIRDFAALIVSVIRYRVAGIKREFSYPWYTPEISPPMVAYLSQPVCAWHVTRINSP